MAYDQELADAVREIERLRKGIQTYLDGDYGPPRDPKLGKLGKCLHERYFYEGCENCIDEHFAALLNG